MRHRTLPVLVLLLALVVAACGDGEGADTTTAGGAETTMGDTAADTTAAGEATTMAPEEGGSLEGTELAVWGWSSSDAENTALNELIASFSEETGANAAFQPQAEYDVALQAALTSGDPPDVFYVDSFRLPDLADAGALAPVPDGAVSNPDDIYPSLREAFTFDGTWYCPPKDFSTLGLVYDPTVLEEAGVAVPTTWEELAAAAEALTTGDAAAIAAGTAQAGLSMGVEYPRWGAFLFQNGASITNEDNTAMTLDTPEAREAIEYVAGLYQDGFAVKPAAIDSGWSGEAFGQNKVAMVVEGNWVAPAMAADFPDKQYAVAELPAGPAGPGNFAFTVCYGVAADAANPEASWQLVDYLTNEEGSLAWTEAFSVMPARQSVAEQWVAAHPELEPFVAGAEYSQRWGFVPGFGDVLGVFNTGIEGVVDGNMTIDQVIADTTAAGEGVLEG
ncbi:MAG TPA: extracellular solute-binding protein [Acidimicrobiia bacterium]|nr:extracellular solute-binding protein [Acidimicrobiia bacterium]